MEIVHLPAAEQRERVNFIPFRQRERVIGLRVGGEFFAVEVLQKIDIAQHIDVCRSVDVIRKEKPLLEGDAVAVRGLGFRRFARGLHGSHILRLKNIVTTKLAEVSICRTILHIEVESSGRPELCALLEADFAINARHNGKAITQKQISAPARIVSRQDFKARAVEISVNVGEPENWRLADIEGGICHDDATVGVESHRAGTNMKIGL